MLFRNVDKQIFERHPQASKPGYWPRHGKSNCDSAIRPDNKTIDCNPGNWPGAPLRYARGINVVAKLRHIRILPNTNNIAIRFVRQTNVESNEAERKKRIGNENENERKKKDFCKKLPKFSRKKELKYWKLLKVSPANRRPFFARITYKRGRFPSLNISLPFPPKIFPKKN